ncbi:hypothetical protein NMH99_001829 [Vibrio parahaemolyticus]|nr:hypothetical protein [Vibrio parahaemolyticus]
MSAICIIDTSVFLNLLNVPGRNQDIDEISASFADYAGSGATFILPMATIVETGNHIAQNGDGGTRRETAKRFSDSVKGAFTGKAPYQPSEFPNTTEILTWIDSFPEHAGRNKAIDKPNEGTSFGDLSIIEEFNKCVSKFSMSEVFIWSLDSDLAAYHRKSD